MNTAITLTLDGLKALEPCSFSKRKRFFASNAAITAAEAREAGATFDDIVWVACALARRDADVERRVRLWVADCAARVLHIYERDAPGDARVRDAIIASRRFARGEVDATALDAAWAAAWAASRAAALDAAWAAAWAASRAAAWDASRAAAWDAARDAAWAAAWDASWAASRDAAERWQLDRLCAWLSADEPEDWPLGEIPAATNAA